MYLLKSNNVIAVGTPADIAYNNNSVTGAFLI